LTFNSGVQGYGQAGSQAVRVPIAFSSETLGLDPGAGTDRMAIKLAQIAWTYPRWKRIKTKESRASD
jgi:hypothetical protein